MSLLGRLLGDDQARAAKYDAPSATDQAAAKDRDRRQKRRAADRRRNAKAEARFEARDRGIYG
ncbi:hypothetical protein GA0115251_106920 [Streptomyces sp. TverLS-915]|uniref:hypothetical protein n=1 Tax=Streptomyces sp. TverLS-915 TaxID=1839763 RepID=UPI00081DDBEE|nr:hypothetical protein [Streptomyces sp. TverLS-915]SCD40956.1 hypothetical protein GA0115251_106920 [Streptomyces sp. TverLS-915]